ncbi:MAG: hypothetical protein ACXAB9_15860 [Candidatus Thorarchaeota archaeon]|jgi:hypothetical protein
MDAIVLTVGQDEYGDVELKDVVFATKDIKVVTRYVSEDVTYEHTVDVNPDKVRRLLGPVELVSMEVEELFNRAIYGKDLQGHLKRCARELLKEDGEDPGEWGLSIEVEPYRIVCIGKYSGKAA